MRRWAEIILLVFGASACTQQQIVNQRAGCSEQSDAQTSEKKCSSKEARLSITTPESAIASSEEFELSWSAVSLATSYDIAISADKTCLDKSLLEIQLTDFNGTKQKFVITKPGTFYICIKAKDGDGNVVAQQSGIKIEISDRSSSSDGNTASNDSFVGPKNLRIVADSSSGLSHSATDDDTTLYFVWDSAVDPENGIKSYTLRYYQGANCVGGESSVGTGTATSYEFTAAAYDATYSFLVVATSTIDKTKTSSCSSSTTINYPTEVFSFNTSSNYTYDNSFLTISGGVASLLSLAHTYDENASTEFGQAIGHNNTAWDTDHLELDNDGSPDPRPLPNDSYYGIDATGLKFLVHLDDPLVVHGDTVYNDFGNHGTASFDSGDTANKSVLGKLGRGLEFDGTDDYVNFGDINDLDQDMPITINAWIKMSSFPGSSAGILSKHIPATAGNELWIFGINSSNEIYFRKENSSNSPESKSSSALTASDLNKWLLISMSAAADGTITFYKNGESIGGGTFTDTDIKGGSASVKLGSYGSTNSYFNGAIDEVSYFARALSSSEIATLYQNQVKNFTNEHWSEAPGLMDGNVLLMHLDEADGNFIDHSGLDNTGESMGTLLYNQSGQIGGALDFQSNGYISFSSPLSLSGGEATYSFWTTEDSSGSSGPSEDAWLMSGNYGIYSGNGGSRISVKNGAGSMGSNGFLTGGQWNHVAVVASSSGTTLYINGKVDNTSGINLAFDVGQIGRYFGWRLEGKMDEIAIWKRALSPQEVQTIYNLQSGTYRGNIHELPNDQDQTSEAWFPMNGNVLLMHMNETSVKDSGANPTIYDYSGQGHHGTFTSGDDGIEKILSGKMGTAINFDGDDVIVIDHDLVTPASQLALSMWFKTSATDVGIYNYSNTAYPVIPGSYANFYIDTSGYLIGKFWRGDLCCYLTSNKPVNDGSWHHFVAVVNSSGHLMFIDGNLTSTLSTPNLLPVGSKNHIGAAHGGGGSWPGLSGGWQPFQGMIDEVAMWNRALSTDEVKKIYDHQSAKYSGTFTSDVIDTGSSSSSWETLSWNMIRPYGKELLGSTQSDDSTSYTALPNDTLMDGNVLLMHMNETTDDNIGDGTKDIQDFSGQSNNGHNAGSISYKALGKFGYGLSFDGTDDRVDLGNPTFTEDTTGTISMWVKTTQADGTLMGLGYWNDSQWEFFRYGITSGKIFVQVRHNTSGTILSATSNNTVNDNQWHLVTVTQDGTLAKIYIDGAPEITTGTNSGAWIWDVASTISVSQRKLVLGAKVVSKAMSVFYQGLMDEVAVWNRALSATEIQELYRRGASRVRYKFRSCDASGCDDEPWLVPDSTLTPYSSKGEFFSELHNTTTTNPSLTFSDFGNLTVSDNQYFQWKAYLDTSDSNEIPELKSVTIGPSHYYGGNPTIVTSNAVNFSSLKSFTDSSSAGTVKYQLSNDGGTTWYWYNSGWTTTMAGYSEASSASDINTNIASFPTGSGSLKVKAYLNSSAGTEQTSLDSISVQYEP